MAQMICLLPLKSSPARLFSTSPARVPGLPIVQWGLGKASEASAESSCRLQMTPTRPTSTAKTNNPSTTWALKISVAASTLKRKSASTATYRHKSNLRDNAWVLTYMCRTSGRQLATTTPTCTRRRLQVWAYQRGMAVTLRSAIMESSRNRSIRLRPSRRSRVFLRSTWFQRLRQPQKDARTPSHHHIVLKQTEWTNWGPWCEQPSISSKVCGVSGTNALARRSRSNQRSAQTWTSFQESWRSCRNLQSAKVTKSGSLINLQHFQGAAPRSCRLRATTNEVAGITATRTQLKTTLGWAPESAASAS